MSDSIPTENSVQHTKPVRVSVVVPCRNEIRHIRAFLDSMLLQKLGPIEMEVLIADGMSDDGTRQVLEEYQTRYAGVTILDNPEQIVSTGLNRAIREAQGEIILRMDAHSVYATDYIRSCVDVLQETNADNVGGPTLTRADGYLAQAIAHAYQSPFARGGKKHCDPRYEGPVETVAYGCWRRSTFDYVGMFDEDLVRSQDYELNVRTRALGGTVWRTPRIVSWYWPRASLSGLFRQYFQYGFWKVAVIRKYSALVSWRNLVPGACLLLGIVLLVCAALARLGNSALLQEAILAPCIAFAGAYLMASLAAAISIARREGWKFLPALPFVFGVYHLSYAVGFVFGLMIRHAARGNPSPIQKVLTAITR